MLLIDQKKFLLLVKLIIQFRGLVISNMNGEDITGSFYEKELQSTNQQIVRTEKIIKRKDNKLYVKWKRFDDLFNSWINKKDIF